MDRNDISNRIKKRKQNLLKNGLVSDRRSESLPLAKDLYKQSNGMKGISKKHDRSPFGFSGSHTFIFRSLLAALFFLALVYGTKGTENPVIKQMTRKAIGIATEREFNFAASKDLFEKYFGSPEIALIPTGKKPAIKANSEWEASGRVIKNFSESNKGLVLGTDLNAKIPSVKKGIVIDVRKKEGLGLTVIVQSSDGSEYWYGMLQEAKVSMYQSIDANEVLGVTSTSKDGKNGQYYLAIKKGDEFIDPKQVMDGE